MAEAVVSLGERLKSRREQLGLSQAQAARELDVARTAYRLWEMEAAKPAPDRWRLVSRWLGMSVAAMLLAEDLIDAEEAKEAEILVGRWGSDEPQGADEGKDFFAQQESIIERGAAEGLVDATESARMTSALERLQSSTRRGKRTRGWRSGEFRKELLIAETAPSEARAALLITAAGIPVRELETAELLISELVTNSVQHGAEGPEGIALHIAVELNRLRVEVKDTGPRPLSSEAAGWGFKLLMEMAPRWGVGRDDSCNLAWFELDLQRPGES
jgi:transcriptional regulator with XRE-family HTH domain